MKNYFLTLCVVLFGTFTNAQIWSESKGCIIDADTEECLANSLGTAVPFLRINPDARSAGMGDVGLAIGADANAMHLNASKITFAKKDFSIGASYSPWLRAWGLKDIYIAYLSGYKQIDKNQGIGFSARYFSLGTLDFKDANGNPNGVGKPREFSLSFAYARKLSENFSTALTAKYIYSNQASGQQVGNTDITSANGFAVDLSFTYERDMNFGQNSKLRIGSAITNLGSKITYTKSTDSRYFLPGNLGIGGALDYGFDNYNKLTFALDINKYLVPTPVPSEDTDNYDKNGDKIADYTQLNLIEGVLGSFADAPGGVKEEFQEVNYSLGLEYWYDNQFALRAGYYHEHRRKGNRRFITLGLGVKYNTMSINVSYLVPTTIVQSPLDNTLRFGLIFDMGGNQAN